MSRGSGASVALPQPHSTSVPVPGVVRRATRAAYIKLTWLVVGAAMALAAITTGASLVGYPAFNVLSGSMEPALGTGSVIIDERIAPLEARPGDVVTFPAPERPDHLITHRVRRVTVQGNTATFVTKGDANKTTESWNVSLDETIGRVALHVPKLGYARAWAATIPGRVIMLAFVVGWGLMSLVEIWRPKAQRP